MILRVLDLIAMKADIHPKYNAETKVACACGNSFVTGSTLQNIETDICSACHPFYTKKQRDVQTGRVEEYQKRMERSKKAKAEKDAIAKQRAAKKTESEEATDASEK